MSMRVYATFPSPFGAFGMVWEGDDACHIHRVALPNERRSIEDAILAEYEALPVRANVIEPVIRSLAARLQSMLEGQTTDLPLDALALETRPAFQQRVLITEHAVPRGWVSTYGRIAAHLGAPGASRAVGHALARNPFPLFIPCHRAIRADGSLGGYQGGMAMKRALLAFEGVETDNANRVIAPRMWY